MNSEAIDQIIPALLKVQATMKQAVRSKVNPHLKNKYATLGDVWDACREELTVNSLALVQTGDGGDDSGTHLVTTLYHTSGQWISSRLCIPLDKNNAQGLGSAITYGRRYGLAALLGIVNDEDDDGNAASGVGAKKAPAKRQERPASAKGNTFFKLPGKPESWGGHGGKPMAECSPGLLQRFVDWCAADQEKAKKYQPELQEAERLLALASDGDPENSDENYGPNGGY